MFWAVIGKSAQQAAKAKSDAPARAESPPQGQPATVGNMPEIIPDDSAADWVVDRFAGNSTAGPEFFPGPACEVGGLGRCGACPLPDGRVLIPFAGGLAEVGTDGVLQLLGVSGISGTTGQVTAGVVAYNPADQRIYMSGPTCVRRLIDQPDGAYQVELAAGTPGKSGYDDGPGDKATFTRIDNVVINSRGTIFILDYNERLRKIENGRVSTLNKNFRSGKRIDGPLAGAGFALIGLGGNICLGENDDVLYLSDHWNFCLRKIDLKNDVVSTVAGMPKPAQWDPKLQNTQQRRYNRNSDGPAMTWASFNSGCAYVCYDPVHKAVWCGGPDESRLRWLRNGEMRTVVGAKPDQYKWPKDGLCTPAEKAFFAWNAVIAVDPQGRVYTSCSGEPNGVWRVYNKKEVKP
jgi:hypothetical protein